MNKYHKEILKEIKNKSRRKTKRKDEAKYIGTPHPVYQISAPECRLIAQKWAKDNKDIPLLDFQDFLSSLNSGKSHEEITFVGKLLELFPAHRKKLDFGLIEKWLGNTSGWAEIDSLCQGIFTADDILPRFKEWERLIHKFALEPSIAKRRASLVLLTASVKKSSDPRLVEIAFKNIEQLQKEKDILITKAVSWILRDLIKHHRGKVEMFLEKNQNNLPKIAIREVKRKLLTGRK